MKRGLLSVFAGAALLMGSASAFAHHSVSGEFDAGTPIEFTGTVKAVQWLNPHIYTQVETKDASGKVQMYRVEGGAPNALFRQGWRKDSVKPGVEVKFKGIRGKNPDSINVNGALTLAADGKKLWMGPGPAAHE
jgi:hypothetical protein